MQRNLISDYDKSDWWLWRLLRGQVLGIDRNEQERLKVKRILSLWIIDATLLEFKWFKCYNLEWLLMELTLNLFLCRFNVVGWALTKFSVFFTLKFDIWIFYACSIKITFCLSNIFKKIFNLLEIPLPS
jgi:hypothetical protein